MGMMGITVKPSKAKFKENNRTFPEGKVKKVNVISITTENEVTLMPNLNF